MLLRLLRNKFFVSGAILGSGAYSSDAVAGKFKAPELKPLTGAIRAIAAKSLLSDAADYGIKDRARNIQNYLNLDGNTAAVRQTLTGVLPANYYLPAAPYGHYWVFPENGQPFLKCKPGYTGKQMEYNWEGRWFYVSEKFEIPKNISAQDLQYLDSGALKDVYIFKSNERLVVAVPNNPSINWAQKELTLEMESLNKLYELGIPTVRSYGMTNVDGKPGLVLENIPGAKSSKIIGDEVDGDVYFFENADTSILDQRSIADLNKIKSGLLDNNIGVNDLQFLISKDGRVVINDPQDIFDYVDPGNIKFINELVKKVK